MIKKNGMIIMMSPTMFDPIALESWNSDETSSQFLQYKTGKLPAELFSLFLFKAAEKSFPDLCPWTSESAGTQID